jgi:hypothetical protein
MRSRASAELYSNGVAMIDARSYSERLAEESECNILC